MWFPTRQMFLLAVVVLVGLLLLVGKVEGLTSSCRTSLRDFDEDKGAYPGDEPPLDAKECGGEKVARKKQCWEAKDGTWKKSDATGCKSWTKVVSWNNKNIREKTGKRPWAKVKDWSRKANKNFNGSGDLWTNTSDYKTTTDCAKKCSDTSDCTGFVFRKSDKLCWGVKQDRVDAGLKGEKGMYAFVKQGTNVSSGGGGSTETTAAGTSSGSVQGSGKIDTIGNGDFFIRVKATVDKNDFSNIDKIDKRVLAYVKHDANEQKCNNTDDNTQIKYDANSINKLASEVAKDNPDHYTWKFTKSGAGYIISNKHVGYWCGTQRKDKKYHQLSPDYKAGSVTCTTKGRRVIHNDWGIWKPVRITGGGYRFHAAECNKNDQGAFLYVGTNYADMTVEKEATVFYLEKRIS